MTHPTPGSRRAIVTLAVLVLLAPPSFAQPAATTEPVPLPGIEVISTTPIAGVGVPKDQIPANVQSAKSADIDRTHANDLSEYMRRRLGSVFVSDVQNNPFQPDVNFRGFTASPLLGTPQGLSLYVDGVRMNQPFGDVVSWDLIPRAAISSIALMPGSNPLFGLNTLGGALSVQTKDGLAHPGSFVQLSGGSYGRAALELESGGSLANGFHWYVTGNRFHEHGWRDASPTDVGQLFGKVGWKSEDTQVSLSAAVADNDMTGNGLQERRLLERDRSSIYTSPDNTRNRSLVLNLSGSQRISSALSFSGNAYYRNLRTSTLNGDVNDDSLDENVYVPGENAANTPFPSRSCIANAQENDEPAEKCNGVNNTTSTRQSNYGLTGQLSWESVLGGRPNLFIAGAAMDFSRVHFTQGSELGYINPDHSVTGVGAFGDGVTGGTVDGEPYDTRVDLTGRTRTWSVFATDTLTLNAATHLTLSGRYNRTTVHTEDAIIPGGGPGSLDGDHAFSRFNPAIGITFSPDAAIGAYAGYNEGSRAPSIIELGCADPANPCKLPNSFAGDPPLKQVVTRTVEAGLRGGAKGRFTWNLGVFRADNKDDILFVADNQAGFGYFKNFGKTRRQGVEAGLNARLGNLNVGANYAYLDATYRSAEVVDGSANSSNDEAEEGLPGVEGRIQINPGDRIPLIPRQILKIFADYEIDSRWSVGLDIHAVAGSFARGNENNRHQADGTYYLGRGRSGGYAVVNLGVDYRPTRKWKVFVQINNLLDREYNTASQLGAAAFDANGNFQARPFPPNSEGDRPLQNSTFYSPGAPRTFLLGVRYAFDG